ncbi:cadherin repeat domain-containing protein [bacterium]|nr:cadherin repeat domain-containing protein [bacterium]
MRNGLWVAILAVAASLGDASAQTLYETDFEQTGDPSGVSFPTGTLTAGGWTSESATVSNETDGAANGTQFVVQGANSSIRRSLAPATPPTEVLMRGWYKGLGDTELVLPSGSTPYAAILGFRNIDAGTLTVAGYNGTTSTWDENNEFMMSTTEWHKIVIHLNYAAGARTYSVAVDDQPVLADIPFHTSSLATLSGFESTSGDGANVDTIGFFISDSDYDNDGVSDAEEVTTAGADPFDPYKPNANEAPTLVALSNNSVDENAAIGTAVGTLSSSDANPSDTFSYAFTAGEGDDDNGSFQIVNGVLQTAAVFNFEAKSEYSILIRTTDSGGLSFDQALTVFVNDRNEAPAGPSISNMVVPENLAPGTLVGTLQSTDPDSLDTASYSLVAGPGADDNALFQVTGGNLVTNAVFDFESQNSYSVRVRVTDSGGLTSDAILAISITNGNDAPTGLDISNDTIAEDVAFGTLVGGFTTTDPDGETGFTYELVAGDGDDDNVSFSIVGNELFTAQEFDFEARDSYTIRVRTTDGGGPIFDKGLSGLSFEQRFDIFISNVNEVPTALAFAQPNPVPENAAIGTVVGTLSSTDPDASDAFTYSLVAGEGDDHNTSFTLNGAEVRVALPLDFESTQFASIRVRTTDAGGLFFDDAVTIEISDTNETLPVLTLSGTSIAENQEGDTVIGSFVVQDAGGFTYDTFEIVGGADSASFLIDGDTLRSVDAFDFEAGATRDLVVQASGEGAPTITETLFTINILDVNETPFRVVLSGAVLANENQPAGSVMASLVPVVTQGSGNGFDPDAGDMVTFAIDESSSENGGADFSISGSNILSTRSFDFEDQSTFELTIIVTDAEGLFSTSVVTVQIVDGPDAPTAISLSGGSTLIGSAAGTVLGTFSTEDQDAGDAFVYTLVDGDGDDHNAAFEIVGGELQIATPPTAAGSLSIRVRSTDSAGLIVEDSFTITVHSAASGWALR